MEILDCTLSHKILFEKTGIHLSSYPITILETYWVSESIDHSKLIDFIKLKSFSELSKLNKIQYKILEYAVKDLLNTELHDTSTP